MSLDLRPSWDEYALTLADAAASRSEDPYFKVGTCLMRPDHSVASLGYNGAPPGVEIDWSDRDARRRLVIHAEQNALRFVQPGSVSLLASTALPCQACMLQAAAYGVRRVLFRDLLGPAYDMTEILKTAEASRLVVDRLWDEDATIEAATAAASGRGSS